MLATTFLLATTVWANDLDLRVTVPDREPVAITLRDVGSGPLPGVVVPGDDTHHHRLTAALSEREDGSFEIAFLLEAVETRSRGRERAEMVARPTMVAAADQRASFEMGYERPVPGKLPVEWELDGYTIEWVVRTGS